MTEMDPDAIRAMARTIYGTERPRGQELRSWVHEGRMSESQRLRLGRDEKPPCFQSDKQWIAWCILEAARPVPNSSYCYDCTLRFQVQQHVNNLCEHPLTLFRGVGQPSVVVGQRPRHRPPRR